MILQRKLGVFYLFTQFLQLLHITVISTISDSCWQSATTEITHRLNGSLIHLPQHNKLLFAPLEQEFSYTIGQLFDNKVYKKILCQPSSVATKPGFKEKILVAWSFVLLCNSFMNNKLANLLWWYEAIYHTTCPRNWCLRNPFYQTTNARLQKCLPMRAKLMDSCAAYKGKNISNSKFFLLLTIKPGNDLA